MVKSQPMLGKTREAIQWAIRFQAEQEDKDGTHLSLGDFNEAGVPAQTSIFVPRHQLAEELREVIEQAFQERGEQIPAHPPRPESGGLSAMARGRWADRNADVAQAAHSTRLPLLGLARTDLITKPGPSDARG
jgi:hypothetical protein